VTGLLTAAPLGRPAAQPRVARPESDASRHFGHYRELALDCTLHPVYLESVLRQRLSSVTMISSTRLVIEADVYSCLSLCCPILGCDSPGAMSLNQAHICPCQRGTTNLNQSEVGFDPLPAHKQGIQNLFNFPQRVFNTG
jgi:hypothetical protein